MKEIFLNIDTIITNALNSLGTYGPLLGCVLILVESILPILPLSVFITLNFYAFGHLIGFIISYILTLIGCNFAFYLCKRTLKKHFENLTKKYGEAKILKLIEKFSNIKFHHLVLLLAFPFTPAFMVNIASGISGVEHKKFFLATVLAKPFMVYFWGYVGVTLLDSLTHPMYLIRVLIILLVAYLISMIVNKKFNLD